jgi:release factor glutamine methyltransferase
MMNTVLEILNKTTTFFQHKGVPNPRLDAQYILAHGLKMKRMDLYLNFDKPLSEHELEVLRPLVARRAKREPLQHIVGSTSFRGHEIHCDRRALIPRPETEALINVIKEIKPHRVLDVGTGSGCIAITAALELPETEVNAVDISLKALAVAKRNATNLGANVNFYRSNLLEKIEGQYD